MTIARDEGGVAGQVTSLPAPPGSVVLLTAGGRYVTVPVSSVRLEKV